MVGIYKIKNKVNHKVYIGESVDIKARWSKHRSDLRKGTHHSKYLQTDWNRYGEKAFKFSIVERFWFTRFANKDKIKIMLLLREAYYMDKYNALMNYNIEYSVIDLFNTINQRRIKSKFKRFIKYKRFVKKNTKFIYHWFPHFIIAMSYNGLFRSIIYSLLVLSFVFAYMKCR